MEMESWRASSLDPPYKTSEWMQTRNNQTSCNKAPNTHFKDNTTVSQAANLSRKTIPNQPLVDPRIVCIEMMIRPHKPAATSTSCSVRNGAV